MFPLFKYLKLQIREALYCLFRGLGAVLILSAAAAAVLFGIYRYRTTGDSNLITVAIVSSEDDFAVNSLMDTIKDYESISSLCTLVRMDEDKAMEGLSSGSIDMVMSVPEDFYEKASGMQETCISIYVPGELSKADKELISVIEGVQKLMVTTEGAINSMYDGMKVYSFPVSTSQMEYELFSDVIAQFLDRDQSFDVRFLSPYGKYTFAQYYTVSAVILVMLLCGVTFFSMYSRGDIQMETILCRSGVDRCMVSAVKIISQTIAIGLILTVFAFAGRFLCGAAGISGFVITGGMILAIWMFALSEAVLIHLTAALGGSGAHTRTIYWLIVLLMMVCSGVIVPAVYLPGFIRSTAGYIPAGQWQGILLSGMWGSVRRNTALGSVPIIIITDVILAAAAAAAYNRSLRAHD